MTCRHQSNDPACSSNQHRYESVSATSDTPDASKYEIEDAVPVGTHLVLKVKYPNCRACSYEGVKVLVYLDVSPVAALQWRKIDPHFADPKTPRPARNAPPPAARFPASAEGWADALDYARGKQPSARRGAAR